MSMAWALVHGRCHHKAIMKMKVNDEEAALKKRGLDFQLLEDGCCGTAGSFGFERGRAVGCGGPVGRDDLEATPVPSITGWPGRSSPPLPLSAPT